MHEFQSCGFLWSENNRCQTHRGTQPRSKSHRKNSSITYRNIAWFVSRLSNLNRIGSSSCIREVPHVSYDVNHLYPHFSFFKFNSDGNLFFSIYRVQNFSSMWQSSFWFQLNAFAHILCHLRLESNAIRQETLFERSKSIQRLDLIRICFRDWRSHIVLLPKIFRLCLPVIRLHFLSFPPKKTRLYLHWAAACIYVCQTALLEIYGLTWKHGRARHMQEPRRMYKLKKAHVCMCVQHLCTFIVRVNERIDLPANQRRAKQTKREIQIAHVSRAYILLLLSNQERWRFALRK